MIFLKLCRNTLSRLLIVLAIISSLIVPPGFCQETEDSQIFIAGFNAYQQKDYSSAIQKMNEVLQKYPDTPLRDMALFWLSRAYFKSGNQQDAGRLMSQFSKEYPDNPLKGTVEEELLDLATRFERGEKLPTGRTAPSPPAKNLQAEKERLAKERADKEQLARALAEQERVAAAKAEEERRAAAKADEARVAAAVAAENARKAAEAEQARIAAAQKAEEERLAVVKAEEARAAAVAAESARKAAEAEQTRIAAARKAEEERVAAEKAEQQRVAAAKAQEERQTAAKAEEARAAAVAAEAARKAAEAEQARMAAVRKAEEERQAALKAEQQRISDARAEEERLAAARAEEARKAAEAEQARVAAAQKAEEERRVAEKAEQVRLAAVRAEEERLAAVKAEEARKAAAAQKAEQERVAAARAEEERLAAAKKAEEERAAAAKAEEQRLALLKAEQERTAAEQAEKERQAAAAAEAARLAALRQERERQAAEKAAAEAEAARQAVARQEQERLAAAKAEEARAKRQAEADEKARRAKADLREKAIAQYRSVLEKYPDSAAAATAAAKLKELGVAVALPPRVAVAEPAPTEGTSQVLRLEVAQFAGFEFNLLERLPSYEVGRRVAIPFEIINRGNGNDSFLLESGFPAPFQAVFAPQAAPDRTITETPVLAPGETFKGLVSVVIPPASIDGLRITHPVKAVSKLMSVASQSREVGLIAAAPLLRAVLKVDKTQPLPGERLSYRLALLNVGSTTAEKTTLRLSYPPQLEPVDPATVGFALESKGVLVLDGLQIKSGESREYLLAFQLKDDSLAGQELLTRADLVNGQLGTSASFVSNVANVRAVHGVAVKAVSERLSIIPGQTFAVPFVVTNTGNLREKFKLAPVVTGGATNAAVYLDQNRDSIRQASEPLITELGPLEPKEEASVLVEVVTPRSAVDGSEGDIQVSLAPEGEAARAGVAATHVTFSRPVLQMAMAGRDGRLKPGEVASFDLTITNRGSNLAKVVELQTVWPEQLELVASDPASSSANGGNVVWKFKELGAGETRTIKVSFRIRFGTSVGTSINVTNVLKYEDQLGNRY